MTQYLLDTNIVLRVAVPKSKPYSVAMRAIGRLLSRGDELMLAPQVLMEFWAAATRPVDVNGYGWTSKEAEAKVAELQRQFPLLPETPAVFGEWLRLVSIHEVHGKQAHDVRLVALMNTHGVPNLLTFNTGDFKRYDIAAVSPEDV